jgi:hypothetical protein
MSLPSKLLFNNKINASYARNFNSVIQAQNTQNYGLGQTAIINIPCMANQVLSGADTLLSLKLRIRNASGAANTAYLNKAGIAGCIQRLRLFSGSQLLCDIDNYGNLVSLLTAHQVSHDHIVGRDQVLQGTGTERGLQLMSALANGSDADFNFCFPLMSVLSLTDNYVPLYAMAGIGALRLELQFVSDFRHFINSTELVTHQAIGSSTIFSDCKLIANFVELSDTAMSIIQNSLEGKPVQWVCQSYSNYAFTTTLQTATTQVSMPIPAKFNSLKALYITARAFPDGADERYSDDTPTFGLQQYTTRIGSRVVPSEAPTTIPQFLSELERALGSATARISPSNYTARQVSSSNPQTNQGYSSAFAVGVETESYSSAPMGSVYQGLNTSTDDIFFQPTYAAQGGATVVRFDAYASYDQLISIDNGMVMVSF